MEEYTETALGRKTNSRVSAHYYIMPLQTSYENGTPVFAAVCLKNVTQISAAEQMINEMNDYWDEESEGLYTSIPITGKVSVMDDELKQYFYEWLMYGDEESSTSEYEQYVCPYLITAVQPDSSYSALSMGALMAVIGAVLVGAVVFVTIKSKRGRHRYVSASGAVRRCALSRAGFHTYERYGKAPPARGQCGRVL